MSVHPKVRLSQINKYDLPYRLSQQFHDCGEYIPFPVTAYKNGPPLCARCKKVVPWFFYKCVICDQYFIQDFRHPKFCAFYPTCWQHTLELPWEFCGEHRPHVLGGTRLNMIVEPIGLNPRKFSDEELANVFEGID
jgi:hypothetical protein